MKNRLLTDAVREIRNTRSRFLSLLVLSALAVAFLAGLRTTAPDMEYTADAYYDAQHLMDLRVVSTLGLTREDIDVLAAQPGVARAEGAYTLDALVSTDASSLAVKLHSLSAQGINTPVLRSGRMPESDGECLVEPALLEMTGLSLGSSITFDTGDADELSLTRDTFTIVGTADSPLYVSVQRGSSTLGSGTASAFVLLPEGAFQLEAYTDAYLLAEGTQELLCYGDAYQDQIDALSDALEPLGEERSGLRYDAVIGEAQEQLSEAEQELADAQAEVDQELSDARAELTDARTELDEGWRDYNDGLQELRDAQAEVDEGWATLRREYADALEEIARGEAELTDALAELEDGEQELSDARTELDEGWQDYWAGAAEYENGVLEYEDGYRQLLDGEETYNESLDTLEEAQLAYDEGLEEYRQGLQELADGGRQLLEAEDELAAAREQLFAGQQALSAGREQLAQQQESYTALSALFQGLTQSWSAAGWLSDTPEGTGAAVGAVLGSLAAQAALDPAAALEEAQALYNGCIAPLSTLLPALSQAAQAAGEDSSALDALAAALPGDGAELLASLTGVEAIAGQAQALTAAYYGAAAALQTTGAALEEGQSALDRAASQLSWGEMEYQDGLEQYRQAKTEYDAGVEEAIQGGQELSDAKTALDQGWAELAQGRDELDQNWADLHGALEDLESGKAELSDGLRDLEEGEADWLQGRDELDEGWQEYEDGRSDLEQAKAELPGQIAQAEQGLLDAQQEISDGETELQDALTQLEDGEAEYADGLREYEDGKAEAEQELSDARRELNDARRELSEMEHCEWYFLGRNTNLGYVSFQQDAQRMGNLASVFPIIFFLVAALVCLTTMTRMVEEQRVEIGGKKALGYGTGAIALKYVGYGLSASLTGGVLGLAVGCTLIPWIIFNAWKILYTVGELILVPDPGVYLLSVGAAVGCVTGAAGGAVASTLAASPAALMRPKAPPIGKRVLLERIGPLWRRLSFTYKVTIRNLFRYQRRFWMTVVGIGGCTALILAAFGLRGSIFDVLDRQYDALFTYSLEVSLADDVTEDEWSELERELSASDTAQAWMDVHQTSLTAESPVQTVDATLFAVSDWDEFAHFIHLQDRRTGEEITPGEDGVVLTEKLAALLEVEPGDRITLDGERRVEATVLDTVENYILHYIYLSAGTYEALFGQAPAQNTILVRCSGGQEAEEALASALIPLSGVSAVSRIQETRDTFTKSMESVDYAVILILVCAAALAFVVLYNLTNINITERLRELATLKVLGFYERELSAYVYRENVFLTLFGIALGLVLGRFLHQWLILTVEIDMLMFGRTLHPASYGYAALLTAVFSLLSNLSAGRSLRRIDMVESLKAIE